MKSLRSLFVAILLAVGLAAAPTAIAPASAAPANCQALPGEIQAYRAQVNSLASRISAHNARPVNTSDYAAVSAYNAEASQLNGERSALIAQGQSLRAQAATCGSNEKVPDVPDPNSGRSPAPPSQPTVPRCPAAAHIGRIVSADACVPVPAPRAKGQGAPNVKITKENPPNINTNAQPLTDLIGRYLPRGGTSVKPTTGGNAGSALGAPKPTMPAPPRVTGNKNGKVSTPYALASQGITLPLSPTQQSSLQLISSILPTMINNPAAKAVIDGIAPNRTITLGNPLNTDDAVANASPAFAKLPGGGWAIGLPRDTNGSSQGAVAYLKKTDWGQEGSGAIPLTPATGGGSGYHSGHTVPLRAGGPGTIPQLLIPELGKTNSGAMRDYEAFLANVGTAGADIVMVKLPIFLAGNSGNIPDYIVVQAWSPNQGWSMPPITFQNY